MSEFKKYMHVERFGHQEVQGIEDGLCYVFPKVDGTNASVWVDGDELCCGSRRRLLSPADDNHGFCSWVLFDDQAEPLRLMASKLPHIRFFGEWLVPHTFKGYRDDAWRRFYIFDVYDERYDLYLPYDCYVHLNEEYDVDIIPPIAKVCSGTKQHFWNLTEQNDYLCKPGAAPGEGIVIKRYEFRNKYGRTVWAKMVRSEFKEANHKEMGVPVIHGAEQVEDKIAYSAVTPTLVQKERAKIESSGNDAPIQPRLLQTVFYCVVTEELWPLLKKLKYPTIDFKRLSRLCNNRTKELAKDLF